MFAYAAHFGHQQIEYLRWGMTRRELRLFVDAIAKIIEKKPVLF